MEQPDWTVHAYNEDFYILRQSGCTHYEKPFLYLIFGSSKALLLDTGAGDNPGTASAVQALLKRRGKRAELIAVHSHGHRDHTAGDAEIAKIGRVVPPDLSALTKEFSIAQWPEQTGSIDLGERVIDAIPIPGHDPVSIALYDRRTGVLLTGDSVYPGRLYVSDWPAFRASMQRLVEFTKMRPVSHVLGTHIEQTRTPFRDYVVGTTFQPNEHALELSRAHLLELAAAVSGDKPERIALRDFTVWPRGPRQTSFFKLLPLGPDLAQHDYKAYMSSIEHLRKTFSSGNWPHKDLTMIDASKDVEGEISRFHARTSFTYAVLNLDGTEERGCVYISPSRKEGFDAQVRMWVTAEDYAKGFQTELAAEVRRWLAAKWPFRSIDFR
jgi:hydroxyacylglutathione hydrolase